MTGRINNSSSAILIAPKNLRTEFSSMLPKSTSPGLSGRFSLHTDVKLSLSRANL